MFVLGLRAEVAYVLVKLFDIHRTYIKILESKTGTPFKVLSGKFSLEIILESELVPVETVKHPGSVIGIQRIIIHPWLVENRIISVKAVERVSLIRQITQV